MDIARFNRLPKALPRPWIWIVMIFVGMVGTVSFIRAQTPPPEPEIVFPAVKTVTALGRLQPKGEIVQLSATTSNEGSRIAQLLVGEGEFVAANQVIAVLDSHDRFQADLAEAQEGLRIARIQLAQTLLGAKQGEIDAQRAEITRLAAEQRGEILAQEATLAHTEAEVVNAQDEYVRYEALYQAGAISASERDSKYLVLQTSRRSVQEAQAVLGQLTTTRSPELGAAEATLNQIQEVRPVDVRAAEAEIARAEAAVSQAQSKLEQSTIKAPQAGTILDIYSRPGEAIADEGVVEIAQIDQMLAIAEIYDSDIHKVSIGQSVTLTSHALPEDDVLRGTVTYVGLKIEQQAVVNEDPTANIDAKVVEVKIKLDEASSKRVRGLTNLQIMATIEI
ncbi:MAG: efflux RND transporter periplasmic adaptor subunit [Cyanobacteria bacterium J06597_16]